MPSNYKDLAKKAAKKPAKKVAKKPAAKTEPGAITKAVRAVSHAISPQYKEGSGGPFTDYSDWEKAHYRKELKLRMKDPSKPGNAKRIKDLQAVFRNAIPRNADGTRRPNKIAKKETK
tara:strand:+ start:298 stop:651 length:354 start_codon:yes stop_codon:yes gene_type:complete